MDSIDLSDPEAMLDHPLLRGWRDGRRPLYQQYAACRPASLPGEVPRPRTDEFFADENGQFPWRDSRKQCLELCPVRAACEVYVMLVVERPGTPGAETRSGVWAGMTQRERYRLAETDPRYCGVVDDPQEDDDDSESATEEGGAEGVAAG